ncbi:uncharacterized protein LOC34619100 [Cyclospora cayetanensis]|uniref:Uncharacterized protein LOC34619100 n=1 Tax=Cyclospora cayetanensis TaxID=88456 RepID=A0A6P6S354_9EIME|nr:uncharacterized protein LOC34619100 [Cyclospora cayetanensis]
MISWRGAAAAAAAAVAAGSVPLRALAHPSHTEQPPRRPESWIQVTLVFLNCFACGTKEALLARKVVRAAEFQGAFVGAFLGLGLLHLMPEAVSQLEASGVVLRLGHGDHEHPYNAAYVLAAAGLTLMLIMEQMCLAVYLVVATADGHHHGDSLSSLSAASAVNEHSPAAGAALPHPAHLHAQQHGSCSEAAYCPECEDCVEAHTAANEHDLGSALMPLCLCRTVKAVLLVCVGCWRHVAAALRWAGATGRNRSDEAYLLQKLQQQLQHEKPTASKGGSKVPLAAALGAHAVLEAIVVGMTRTTGDVWISTLAILGHKGAEAVALSSALLKARTSGWVKLACLFVFVMATPIGVLIGGAAAVAESAAAGVLNALAVGIILYACIEMLAEFEVKARFPRRMLRCFAFLCGLGLLFGLDLLHAPVCHHSHSHEHNHSHSHSHAEEDVSGASAAVATVLERSHLRHLHYDPSTRHVVHHHDEEYQNLPRALTGAADAGARANASASTP